MKGSQCMLRWLKKRYCRFVNKTFVTNNFVEEDYFWGGILRREDWGSKMVKKFRVVREPALSTDFRAKN